MNLAQYCCESAVPFATIMLRRASEVSGDDCDGSLDNIMYLMVKRLGLFAQSPSPTWKGKGTGVKVVQPLMKRKTTYYR